MIIEVNVAGEPLTGACCRRTHRHARLDVSGPSARTLTGVLQRTCPQWRLEGDTVVQKISGRDAEPPLPTNACERQAVGAAGDEEARAHGVAGTVQLDEAASVSGTAESRVLPVSGVRVKGRAASKS